MKLRNKENRLTGKLTCIDLNIYESEKEIYLNILLDNSDGECIDRYFYSLDELKKFLGDWEEIKEPLIKDEKNRKAVRAWAEANGIGESQYHDVEFYRSEHRLKWIRTVIEFDSIEGLENLDDGRKYTITELCGEEEE